MAEARRWYAHIDYDDLIAGLADGSIPVAKLEALTGGRTLRTTLAGVIEVGPALTANRMVYSSGTGTVESLAAQTQNRVGTFDANGLLTSAAAITASRALISDANGLPTHATLTSANLENVVHTVTDTSSIDLTKSSGSLSADIVSGGVTAAMLAASAGGAIASSGTTAAAQNHTTTLTTCASIASYAARKATSTLLLIATGDQIAGAGTSTIQISHSAGTNITNKVFNVTGAALITATFAPGDTTARSYEFRISNTTPAGSMQSRVIHLIDLG